MRETCPALRWKRRRRLVLGVGLALWPLAAIAGQNADLPERASTLVVYGDDPCPKPAEPDEIVVCARRPESERYRIPEGLREDKEQRGAVAWGTRFDEMEEATRFTRPNSCSVVGTWGQTGCFDRLIRDWRAERRALETGTGRP
jgi:hypothetical protein